MAMRPQVSSAVSMIAWPRSGVATLLASAIASPPRPMISFAAARAASPPEPSPSPSHQDRSRRYVLRARREAARTPRPAPCRCRYDGDLLIETCLVHHIGQLSIEVDIEERLREKPTRCCCRHRVKNQGDVAPPAIGSGIHCPKPLLSIATSRADHRRPGRPRLEVFRRAEAGCDRRAVREHI